MSTWINAIIAILGLIMGSTGATFYIKFKYTLTKKKNIRKNVQKAKGNYINQAGRDIK